MNDNAIKLRIGCDKIIITASPHSSAEYGIEFVKAWRAEAKCGMVAVFASAAAQAGYQIAIRLLDPAWPLGAAPLLQAAPYDPKKPMLRLEFNPNNLGAVGMAALKKLLDFVTPHGWSLFLAVGRVSRVDVNVDAGGLAFCQIVARARCSRTSELYSRKGDIESVEFGEAQTLYLGKKTVSKQLYRIYGLDDDKVPIGCSAATRFEAVDRKSRPLLTELSKLKFPFLDLKVFSTAAKAPSNWPTGEWEMFLIFAADHGLPAARKKLTSQKRKLADAALATAPVAGLDFKKLWEGWPGLLSDLGLTPPSSGPTFMPGYASEFLAA